MEKPDLDYIEGLSPAISIEQRTVSKNPRSTVGTVTEIYDYLRLLYARIGVPHCPDCGREISQQTPQEVVDDVLRLPDGERIQILAPLVRGRKGEYQKLFERVKREGYVRVRVDGEVMNLDEPIKLDRYQVHTIEVVVDRLKVSPKIKTRLTDSVETSLKLGEGLVLVNILRSSGKDGAANKDRLYSEHFACHECGISLEEMEPRLFSFNSPYGACPVCDGLGTQLELDEKKVVPDLGLSIMEGALAPIGVPRGKWFFRQVSAVADYFEFELTTPFGKIPLKAQKALLYGSGKKRLNIRYEHGGGRGHGTYIAPFEGIIPNLRRRYRQTESSSVRTWIEQFMKMSECPACDGTRLRHEALAVLFRGKRLPDIVKLPIETAESFFCDINLNKREEIIARQILKEIRERLRFLIDVGLSYLSLDRRTGTLSGGEAQRIRLATQIGSQLVGVLYILDEPSIGLHHRDNRRLLDTLARLRDLGNTVLVVEHDCETILRSDYVIDLGPGAGLQGGEIVVCGTPDKVARTKKSLTGDYLSGRRTIDIPSKRRRGNGHRLTISGASGNNLKKLSVSFPLGTFICVTGVSGSGKSTLVNLTLYPVLAQRLMRAHVDSLPYKNIKGIFHLNKVIDIDQTPIGRTPRSNPATYTGLFTPVRELFSKLPESKLRGYKPGRFSFNVKGGRCEACRGAGIIKIEMHFLPDVYVQCEVCKGLRYNRETLEIAYRGKNITEILNMTVEEALEFFAKIPSIKKKLQTLHDVGLRYIHLGQQATTLSGGEAQRVKLSAELSRTGTGNTLYILDEPTMGLHMEDVKMLLKVLNRLVDHGNTVIVIEHNMDVIKVADWIIDLGPEGGDRGGTLIAVGTPEKIASHPTSYTGQYLAKIVELKDEG